MRKIQSDTARTIKKQAQIEATLQDVKSQLRTMQNWKAPGPNGIQGYWLKGFDALLVTITNCLNGCVTTGRIPAWMVEERTILLMKDRLKGPEVDYYRPIACLNLFGRH